MALLGSAPLSRKACMMLHEEAAARSLQKGAFFWQTDCAKAAEEVQELPVFEKAVTALSMTLAATGGAGQVRSLCEKFTQSVCVCVCVLVAPFRPRLSRRLGLNR